MGTPAAVNHRLAEVLLRQTLRLLARAPLGVDARCQLGSDPMVLLFADKLDLFVVADMLHVRTVLVLADDADEKDEAVSDVARVWTVDCK